ncbi:MAG: aminotransferase class I/II-fold pyridoxal phosphate-dependent enzyme, partial [Desulfobacterales bacterium]|nr:aminotransferase class I/II-fold pyridoxal phosphate-dependent enzyme [Desulfobacterales bacterium]
NPYFMDLLKENDFLPDLDAVPVETAKNAKLMFLNYPNNPTSAIAKREFFKNVVSFAKSNNIIVCHDAAYTEMAFDGYQPISFLEAEGASGVGIEFHSLSKTYNMTGWRLGFAVGRPEIIEGLGGIKSNIDSGAFQAIQIAGIAALEGDQTCVQNMNKKYQERRNILVDGVIDLGLSVKKPKATFYVWIEVPDGYRSATFTTHLLTKGGIVVTPGNGFGSAGEGYVRMALTVGKERLKEVIERIRAIGF